MDQDPSIHQIGDDASNRHMPQIDEERFFIPLLEEPDTLQPAAEQQDRQCAAPCSHCAYPTPIAARSLLHHHHSDERDRDSISQPFPSDHTYKDALKSIAFLTAEDAQRKVTNPVENVQIWCKPGNVQRKHR